MKIILDIPFVTLNEYINAERSSKYKAAKIKSQQTNSVYYLALQSGLKLEPVLHNITFHWYKPNNKIDHDNIAFAKKFILDGLVKAKVLENDTPKFVGNFTDRFLIDKTRKYVSCCVYFDKP